MEENNRPRHEVLAGKFFTAAMAVIAILVGFLPALYLPFISIPFQLSKTYLLYVAVFASAILFLIGSFFARRITLPRHWLIPIAFLPALAYTLSALFSPHAGRSFFDSSLSVDTALTFFLLAMLTLLTSALFHRGRAIVLFGFAALLGAAVVALVELAELLFGIPLPVFAARTANIIGKWNDVGIYFGLVAAVSLYATTFANLPSRARRILFGVLGLSLLLVAAVNFFDVWAALLAASAVFLSLAAWKLSAGGTAIFSRDFFRRLPRAAVFVLVLALVFVLFHGPLSVAVGNALSVYSIEARPSWGSTLHVARETYKTNPFFGSGPRTFAEQWHSFKPAGVNETPFWSIDFAQGVGVAPTALVSAGVLGGLAWLVLLFALLSYGLRFFRLSDRGLAGPGAAAYIAALYLFAMLVIYVPAIPLLALAFLALGVFIAQSKREHPSGAWSLPLALSPAGIPGAALAVVFALGSLYLAYGATVRMVSGVFYQRGLNAYAAGNLQAAEGAARTAFRLRPDEGPARLITDIGLSVLQSVAVSAEGTREERTARFQEVARGTVNGGFTAVSGNPRNPANWLSLGRIYELLLSVGVTSAYDDAKVAYERARLLSPHDPSILLALARLEAAKGDRKAARDFVARALREKKNYTAAVLFLSQLEIADGNIKEAINQSAAAVALSPNDSVLWFRLGFLEYSLKRYDRAAAALERAIGLQENYSNARYFLGLSYYRLERVGDAIAQFERVASLNPGNAEVAAIIGNLHAGKEPFAGTKPPVSTPEKRSEPPISE